MRRHYLQVFEQHGVCLSVPGNGISDISGSLFLLIWPKVEVLMAGNKGRTGATQRGSSSGGGSRAATPLGQVLGKAGLTLAALRAAYFKSLGDPLAN